MWGEIQDTANREKPDIICLTETHWNKASKGQCLTGFKTPFLKRREVGSKKGGGIAVFVRKNLTSFEWSSNRNVEEEDNHIEEEQIWIVIKGQEVDMALGVVYMAVDGTNSKEWNDDLGLLGRTQ